jgi:hypothetical protein
MDESADEMRASVEYSFNLADQILRSAGADPLNAFMKGVGTLAQIIHIITPDDQREQTLESMMTMLRTYLGMLDKIRGPSTPTMHPPR